MSRARDTAGIIQYNKISIDSNNAVGIGSSIPDTKLDVNGGVRVTGIITASSFQGDGSALTGISTENLAPNTLEVAGISTFNGNIVPNGAINFGGSSNLTLGDNNALHVGAGNDLRILHSGGDSVINHAGTDGEFALLTTNEVRITNTGFAKTAAVFKPAGATELYHNHSKKFETVGTGISISGNTETRDLVSVKSTDGTPGRVDLYCEVSNAHYARLVAPAHSEFSGNVTATLPTKSGDIVVGNTGHIQITDSINTTGIITASSYRGDGSQLTGISAGGFDFRDGSLFN